MPKKYKLRTIKDVFELIPADKIALCMSEIARGMEYAKRVNALIDATAPGSAGIWPDECEWIDDGEGSITLNYMAHETAKPVMSFVVKKK